MYRHFLEIAPTHFYSGRHSTQITDCNIARVVLKKSPFYFVAHLTGNVFSGAYSRFTRHRMEHHPKKTYVGVVRYTSRPLYSPSPPRKSFPVPAGEEAANGKNTFLAT
jgi:hypothetical protein